MGTRKLLASRAVLVFVVIMNACTATSSSPVGADEPTDAGDGDDGWSYDGPQSACSTGAALRVDDIPALPRISVRPPGCLARCGVEKEGFGSYGFVWTTDALPSGECEHDGEVCSMTAVRTRTCEDGERIACSQTGYVCRCEGMMWRCYHGSKGRSACICDAPQPDAGVDAESSDASID